MSRYIRQEILIGRKGQDKLAKSKAVIVGIGALGCISSELLARAGIGKLTLIDRDIVDLSNLQRQTLYDDSDIDTPKAIAAEKRLRKINPEIKIECYATDLTSKNTALLRAGIIVDGTDNFEARRLINEYAVKNRIPWVYGAAIEDKGYIWPIMPGKPCFSCAFRQSKSTDTCETSGILNAVSSAIGAMQANQAIRILLGRPVESRLLHVDLGQNLFTKLDVTQRPDCPVCVKGQFDYLSGKKGAKAVRFCGAGTYQIRGDKVDMSSLAGKLEAQMEVKKGNGFLHFRDIVLFEDGRALIRAKDEKQARSEYAKWIGS